MEAFAGERDDHHRSSFLRLHTSAAVDGMGSQLPTLFSSIAGTCVYWGLQGGRSSNHVTRSSSGDLSEPGSRMGGRSGSSSGAVPHAVPAQPVPLQLLHAELQPVPQPIANGTAPAAAQKAQPAADAASEDTASAAAAKNLSKEKRNAKLGEGRQHPQGWSLCCIIAHGDIPTE